MDAVLHFRPVSFLLLYLFSAVVASAQVSCKVQPAPTDSAAEALVHRDYPKANELYAAQVKSNPKDFGATAGLVRSLVESQQVDAAATLAENSFAAHQQSAALATALGEVRYRQGRIADAYNLYRTADGIDQCLARTHYDLFWIFNVESMNASAYSELQTAHALEPGDWDINMAWIRTLPLAERARRIDSMAANAKNDPQDEQKWLKLYSDRLHATIAAQTRGGGCHLASGSPTATKLPIRYTGKDAANEYHGVGLDVKINNKASARLVLDTGASGILVDRGTAKKAGLMSLVSMTIGGIGDEKNMNGFWAYADDFRVGGLEFQNCMIEVSDQRSIVGVDGLIGADVFQNYHVQLDFPMQQVNLSPLPVRPGQSGAQSGSLNTSGVSGAAESTDKSSVTQPAAHYMDRYVSPEMKSWSRFVQVNHHILIDGKLADSSPRLFLVDTGAGQSALSVPAGKTFGKLHSVDDEQITGISGRVRKLYSVNQVNLTFAGLHTPFQDILVMPLDNQSKSFGTEVSGIIGLDTLFTLTVDIDYRDGLIHLRYDPKRGLNIRQ